MSIRIQCGHCGAKRKVNERLAGRTIRCPNCENPLTIPGLPDAPAGNPAANLSPAANPISATNPGPAAQSAMPVAKVEDTQPFGGPAMTHPPATPISGPQADDSLVELEAVGDDEVAGGVEFATAMPIDEDDPQEFTFDDEPAPGIANVYAGAAHPNGNGAANGSRNGDGDHAPPPPGSRPAVSAAGLATERVSASAVTPAGSAALASRLAKAPTSPAVQAEPAPKVDDDFDEGVPPRKKREDGELDMTPMVDVTFLLLIFFMVTASFSLQKSIQSPRQSSDLPSMSNVEEETDELDPIELEIDESGAFLVLTPDWERETPGKQNLISALKQAIGDNRDGMRLDIKVHENAKLQMLVDGMDAGTIAGFTEIKFTEVDGFD